MEQEKQKIERGLDLGLGPLEINIELSVTGFRTLTDTLQQYLADAQGALSENMTKLVDKIDELGVENIRNWAMSGGNETKQLFNKLYSQLEELYKRGMTKAGDLLERMGDRMQDVASEDPGITH